MIETTTEPGPLVLKIKFVSFAYSLGPAPKQENIHVFNLRKLPNPSSQLRRNRTGLDKELQKEFFQIPQVEATYQSLKEQVQEIIASGTGTILLQFYFGCHAGKHRSVAFVDKMSKEMWQSNYQIQIQVTHRDLEAPNMKTKKEKGQKRTIDRAKKYSSPDD